MQPNLTYPTFTTPISDTFKSLVSSKFRSQRDRLTKLPHYPPLFISCAKLPTIMCEAKLTSAICSITIITCIDSTAWNSASFLNPSCCILEPAIRMMPCDQRWSENRTLVHRDHQEQCVERGNGSNEM